MNDNRDRDRIRINRIIDLYFDTVHASDRGAVDDSREKAAQEQLVRSFMEWLADGVNMDLKEEALFRKFEEIMRMDRLDHRSRVGEHELATGEYSPGSV